MNASYEKARSIALMLLGSDLATEEQVERAVDSALRAVSHMQDDELVDRDALLREIESKVRVWVGVSGVLDDPRGHEEWLPGRRGQLDWRFWTRYRRFLEEEQAFPRIAILRTDDLTDKISGPIGGPETSWSVGSPRPDRGPSPVGKDRQLHRLDV